MKNRLPLLSLLIATSLLAFNFSNFFGSLKPLHTIDKDLNSKEQKVSQEYIERLNINNKLPKILEKEAIFVLNEFINTLQNNNFRDSAHMVVPLIHKSLLSKDARELDEDTMQFSFKKAHTNAKNYAYPVKITRIDRLKTTEIGYRNTHEVGVEFKFWIAKKNKNGYSAPLVLFFKQNGSNEPKLSYVGSL